MDTETVKQECFGFVLPKDANLDDALLTFARQLLAQTSAGRIFAVDKRETADTVHLAAYEITDTY